MSNTTIPSRGDRELKCIKQLGLYKLLFSQKAAFCFVLLFVSTAIVIFSGWAVCKHYIDSSTFGTVIVTFGGIAATIAGIYNIVHGINDRASMQIAATTTAPPSAPPPPPAPPAPPLDPATANLPSKGTL
jgi:hypothetical protein